MRIMAGIVVGAVLAMLCVAGIEWIGMTIYPPPAGIDYGNPADLERLMAMVTPAQLGLVALGWFVGALLGAWAADAIAGRALAGWAVALLLLAACVYNLLALPHPAWMWACGILLPLLAGWLAQRLAKVAI